MAKKKKEEKVEPSEEVVEEKPEISEETPEELKEETPEVPKETEEETEEPEPVPEEKLIPESKVQERFDEMTASIKRLERDNEFLKAHKPAEQKPKEIPDDQLRAMANENPELATWANDQLTQRRIDRAVEKKLATVDEKYQRQQSWERAKEEYPEVKDKNSALFKLADEIFRDNPELQKIPQGQYAAVKFAYADLAREQLKNTTKKTKTLSKKLKKSQRSTELESGDHASTVTPPANLRKLEEKAIASGDPYGPEWKEYLRAQQKSKTKGE